MSENEAPNVNERQIEAALKEELDRVAPRRDLWPTIQESLLRQQPKPQRRWLDPASLAGNTTFKVLGGGTAIAVGSLAVLGVAVVAILLFAMPLLPIPAGGGAEPAPAAPERPSPPAVPPTDTTSSAAPSSTGGTSGGSTSVTVSLKDPGGSGSYKFDPNEFSFSAGETVSFTFNAESEFHTFTVDGLDIDVSVDGGASETFTFTFDTPGEYKLFCVPHEFLGMVGTVTVR